MRKRSGRLSKAATVAQLGCVIALSSCGSNPSEPEPWPDGAYFYLGAAGFADTALSWSPTGNVMLYTSGVYGDPDLFAYDRVTDPVLVSSTSMDESVGPVGCWTDQTNPGLIIFTATDRDSLVHTEVRTMTGNLGPMDVILDDSLPHLHPTWSVDADTVLLCTRVDGRWSMYAASYPPQEEQIEPQEFYAPQSDVLRPSYSPQGDWILFESRSADQGDVWIIRPDGSDSRALVEGPADECHPCWSPYQGWFVYSSNTSGQYELYVTNLAGDTTIRLTDDPGDDIYPAWNPGIEGIVFSSDRVEGEGSYDILAIDEPPLPGR
jgi:hypothetical protein